VDRDRAEVFGAGGHERYVAINDLDDESHEKLSKVLVALETMSNEQ
jgi:hypothetical protein